MNPIPLSVYIHIPWCIKKCPYCDFNSYALDGNTSGQSSVVRSPPDKDDQENGQPIRLVDKGAAYPISEVPPKGLETGAANVVAIDSSLEDAYISALTRDLRRQLDTIEPRPVSSVFFGGGTPSLFSGSAIARILTQLNNCLPLAADAEITLEANPGASDSRRFRDYRAAGVNRLSIGAQSFNNRFLRQLGRVHAGADTVAAVEHARNAGFDNISLDLMHGLPGQTPAQAVSDLDAAFALEPEHLSWYQLTVEPNTAFHKHPPVLPDDDQLADIEDAGLASLVGHGYERYEVSAYAQAGRECGHNLNYWTFGDYVGLGAGAHGKLTSTGEGAFGVARTNNSRAPKDYLAATTTRSEPVTDLFLEFMLNALRLTQGFSQQMCLKRTRLPETTLDLFLKNATGAGFVSVDGDNVRPTLLGQRFLNDVILLASEQA